VYKYQTKFKQNQSGNMVAISSRLTGMTKVIGSFQLLF